MSTQPREETGARDLSLRGRFWIFWSATAISAVGTGLTTVALPLAALTLLDASSFEVSLITAASYAAAVLIGLPAGVLVQRYPLRGVQVSMDVFRALVLTSVPLAAWMGVLSIWQLVLVALAVSLASNIFAVANSTFLPALVGRDELTARNSLISATHATTKLAGPSLGGLLVQLLGAATSIVLDVVSYLISAVLLWRLPGAGSRRDGTSTSTSILADIREGLSFVYRHRVVWACTIAATVVNVIGGALLAITPVFLLRTLHLAPGVVGAVMAVDAIGSLIGAAITTRMAGRIGSARTMVLVTGAGAGLALLMPLPMPGWAGPLSFALGSIGLAVGVSTLSILARTHRQTVTPMSLLSRVMASVRFVSWAAIPVGSLTGGAVATATSPRTALWLTAAGAVLAPLWLLVTPVRGRRDLITDDEALPTDEN